MDGAERQEANSKFALYTSWESPTELASHTIQKVDM